MEEPEGPEDEDEDEDDDEPPAPEPTLPPDALLAKDSDFIAAEVECRRDNIPGLFVQLDIPGLEQDAQ